MIQEKNQVLSGAGTGRFGRFQMGSKTTKTSKNDQKPQKLAGLKVLAKIIGPALRFDQFSRQSDQKSHFFRLLKKIRISL